MLRQSETGWLGALMASGAKSGRIWEYSIFYSRRSVSKVRSSLGRPPMGLITGRAAWAIRVAWSARQIKVSK